MLFLTPTLWEEDPGVSFWNSLLQWHVNTDAQFGQKAKEVFGGRWPPAQWVFDAVSLGIQTAGTLQGVWAMGGLSRNRPIGLQHDPNNNSNDAVLFSPETLVLSYDSAEQLIHSDPFSLGNGIVPFRCVDDPFLTGDYTFYVQVERIYYPDGSLLKEASHPEVYVIAGSAPIHVPDPDTLNRLYPPGFAAVQVVPDGTIATLPATPTQGALLREESRPEVWRIEGRQKRHITDPRLMPLFGGWGMVRLVPDNATARIPAGQPIT